MKVQEQLSKQVVEYRRVNDQVHLRGKVGIPSPANFSGIYLKPYDWELFKLPENFRPLCREELGVTNETLIPMDWSMTHRQGPPVTVRHGVRIEVSGEVVVFAHPAVPDVSTWGFDGRFKCAL
jgi:hypothetical protein